MTSWALPCWNQASDFLDHTSVQSRCRWSVANREHSTFPTFRHWRPTTSPSWCSSRSTAWPRRGWPRRRPRPRWSRERSTPDAGRFRSNIVHLNWNKVFKVRIYWNMENIFLTVQTEKHSIYENIFLTVRNEKHSIYDNFYRRSFLCYKKLIILENTKLFLKSLNYIFYY